MKELRELRKHPRFECDGVAEIHLLGVEKPCPARIEDLSLKGCKLALLGEPEDEPEFDLPAFFELTFTVNELSFRVRARSTGLRLSRYIGVEFVDLRPRMKRYILDLVEELAEGGWKPMLQREPSNRTGARVLLISPEK